MCLRPYSLPLLSLHTESWDLPRPFCSPVSCERDLHVLDLDEAPKIATQGGTKPIRHMFEGMYEKRDPW